LTARDDEYRLLPPRRRPAREVRIGNLRIGGSHPVLIQSMTTSSTTDTDEVVGEIAGMAGAGCPLVRLAVPTVRAAENLGRIRSMLQGRGVDVALAADVHFSPEAAMIAADHVEKVRINPGNFADSRSTSCDATSAGEAGTGRMVERFIPLVRKLKERNVALRIGVNHGSLSGRIMTRFGDTPEGMVVSALEYLRLCRQEDFHQVVISMKSSIPAVTVAAYRLLVERMGDAGMDYPLHLGLTEAGDGLDGRIRSAVAMGALLADGIGDTVRVSLTEDSRHEIPAARALLEAVGRERTAVEDSTSAPPVGDAAAVTRRPWSGLPAPARGERRRSRPLRVGELVVGGTSPVRVELCLTLDADRRFSDGLQHARPEEVQEVWLDDPADPGPELISVRPQPPVTRHGLLDSLDLLSRNLPVGSRPDDSARHGLFLEWSYASQNEIHFLEAALPHVDGLSLALPQSADRRQDERFSLLARLLRRHGKPVRWRLGSEAGDPGEAAARLLALFLREDWPEIGFLCEPGTSWVPRIRALARALGENAPPIFLEVPGCGPDPALLAGSVLTDGIGDSICLAGSGFPWPAGPRPWTERPVAGAFAILQACRLRMTRAEIIACPSCGRTLFDLQTVTARVRERMGHLAGVKIAVMGCIVNGPGEMADADFGYVGSAAGTVDLYVGRTRIRRGIPEHEAPDRLVDLIREHGRWVDPVEEEL